MPALLHQVGGHAGVMADESGSLVIKPAMTREIAFYQLLSSTTAPGTGSDDDDDEPLSAMSAISEVFGFRSRSRKGARREIRRGPASATRTDGQSDHGADKKINQDALLYELRRFVPRFLGTLTLQGKAIDSQRRNATDEKGLQGGGQQMAIEPVDGAQESIVLQDLTYPFLRPCVLDVKLGKLLADESATAEKRDRMEKKSKETTSWETGLRLTGFQTWDYVNSKVVNTSKAFGYGITADQLPDGMRRFFKEDYSADPTDHAIATIPEEDPQKLPAHAQGETMTSVDLDETPRQAPPASSSIDSPKPVASQSAHLNAISRVLSAALVTLDELIRLFEQLEIRMVGASILIVYEGDPDRLIEAWRLADAGKARADGLEDDVHTGLDSDSDGDSEAGGEVMEVEVDADMPAQDLQQLIGRLKQGKLPADEEERVKLGLPPASAIWSQDRYNPLASDPEAQRNASDESDDDEHIASDDEEERRPRPFSLRLIDFAHTRLAHGEGPDEGVLLGMRTLRRLLQGRKEEIDAAILTS